MPSNWHSIHRATRRVLWSLNGAGIPRDCATRNAPNEPIVKSTEYKDMAPFFVAGESGEP